MDTWQKKNYWIYRKDDPPKDPPVEPPNDPPPGEEK